MLSIKTWKNSTLKFTVLDLQTLIQWNLPLFFVVSRNLYKVESELDLALHVLGIVRVHSEYTLQANVLVTYHCITQGLNKFLLLREYTCTCQIMVGIKSIHKGLNEFLQLREYSTNFNTNKQIVIHISPTSQGPMGILRVLVRVFH